jgi:hypothetical protein
VLRKGELNKINSSKCTKISSFIALNNNNFWGELIAYFPFAKYYLIRNGRHRKQCSTVLLLPREHVSMFPEPRPSNDKWAGYTDSTVISETSFKMKSRLKTRLCLHAQYFSFSDIQNAELNTSLHKYLTLLILTWPLEWGGRIGVDRERADAKEGLWWGREEGHKKKRRWRKREGKEEKVKRNMEETRGDKNEKEK